MKKVLTSVAAVLLLAVSLTSCNGGGAKGAADKFLTALYHGDYAGAKTYATTETQKQVDAYEQVMGMMDKGAKDEMKKAKVTIKDAKEEGDNATVNYTLSTDSLSRSIKMVKQSGKWLAQTTKMELMGPAPTGGGSMNNMGNGGGNMQQGGSAPDTMMAPPADGAAPSMPDTAKHAMH